MSDLVGAPFFFAIHTTPVKDHMKHRPRSAMCKFVRGSMIHAVAVLFLLESDGNLANPVRFK